MPNMSAERMFTVAEYRKPEFLVQVLPAVDEALRGETVDVTMEIVALFSPTDEVLASIARMLETEPIPIDELPMDPRG